MVTKGSDSKRYLRLKDPLRVHGRDDGIVDAWLYDGDGFIVFSTFVTAMHVNHLIMAKVLEAVNIDVKMACDYPKADDGMSFFGVAKKLIQFSDIPTIVEYMVNEIGAISANANRIYDSEQWNAEDIIGQFHVNRLMLVNPGPDTKTTKKKRPKKNSKKNEIDLVNTTNGQESNQSIFDNDEDDDEEEEEPEEEEEDLDEYENKYGEKRKKTEAATLAAAAERTRRSFHGAHDNNNNKIIYRARSPLLLEKEKEPDVAPSPPPPSLPERPVSSSSSSGLESVISVLQDIAKDFATNVANSQELMGPFCFNNYIKKEEFQNLVKAEVVKQAKAKELDLEDVKRNMEIQLRSRIEAELSSKVMAQHKSVLDTHFDNQAAQLRVLRHTAEFEANRITQEALQLKVELEQRMAALVERERRATEKFNEGERKLKEAHQLNVKAFADSNNYL